jgi:hypothetical protein
VPVPPVAARGWLARPQRGIKRFGLVFADQHARLGPDRLPDNLIEAAPRVVVIDTPVAEKAVAGIEEAGRVRVLLFGLGRPGLSPWRPLSL